MTGDLMNAIPPKPVSLLLLSGGVGARSKHHEPKQFFELCGHPMMAYAVIAATKIDAISEILVNAPAEFHDRTREVMEHYCGGKPFQVLQSGETRQESSFILAQAAQHDITLLHETARPFVTQAMYKTLLDDPEENAGYFHNIPFSMCKIDLKTNMVIKGVSREKVFDVQLPQKFNRDSLVAAHHAAIAAGKVYNEDSVMVTKMTDAKVHALSGSGRNIKVTSQEDFTIAENLMKSKKA
jgi:2-C-methyl-D-erythritol 4-phosphate cytidylyltransferase